MATETTGTTAELDAIGEALVRAVEEAVPAAWSNVLEVDRRRDWLRVRADVFKLKKHNYEFLCSVHALELKTPKKRYRFGLKGFTPESEFSGTHLVVTLRTHPGVADRGHQGSELDRATWRVVRAAKGWKRVFVTRAINAVADLAERSPERSLEAATAAPSDWEVLLRALSSTGLVEPASVSDPLAGARLRGIHARRQLLQAEGGAIPAAEVADILAISRQAVDKRRQAGTLLAINVGGHGYHYPAWQFEQSGVIGGLGRVLKALAHHDDWMKLAFFVNANDRLKGESPLKSLRRGDVQPVLDAAESYGEHGAA
jgi:hypothetical protein